MKKKQSIWKDKIFTGPQYAGAAIGSAFIGLVVLSTMIYFNHTTLELWNIIFWSIAAVLAFGFFILATKKKYVPTKEDGSEQ